MLAAGLALGLMAGALLPAHRAIAGAALGGSVASGLAAFTLRLPKSLGRALPGATLGFAFIQGLRLGPVGWILSGSAALVFAAAFVAYRKRGPHRGPCDTCPDRDQRPACRGFAPILKRERALQRLAGRLIAQGMAARFGHNEGCRRP